VLGQPLSPVRHFWPTTAVFGDGLAAAVWKGEQRPILSALSWWGPCFWPKRWHGGLSSLLLMGLLVFKIQPSWPFSCVLSRF